MLRTSADEEHNKLNTNSKRTVNTQQCSEMNIPISLAMQYAPQAVAQNIHVPQVVTEESSQAATLQETQIQNTSLEVILIQGTSQAAMQKASQAAIQNTSQAAMQNASEAAMQYTSQAEAQDTSQAAMQNTSQAEILDIPPQETTSKNTKKKISIQSRTHCALFEKKSYTKLLNLDFNHIVSKLKENKFITKDKQREYSEAPIQKKNVVILEAVEAAITDEKMFKKFLTILGTCRGISKDLLDKLQKQFDDCT